MSDLDKIALARITGRLIFGEQITFDGIQVIRLFRKHCGLTFVEAKRATKEEFISRGWTPPGWLSEPIPRGYE